MSKEKPEVGDLWKNTYNGNILYITVSTKNRLEYVYKNGDPLCGNDYCAHGFSDDERIIGFNECHEYIGKANQKIETIFEVKMNNKMTIGQKKVEVCNRLLELAPSIKEWHTATFPDVTEEEQRTKYNEEIREARAVQDKLLSLETSEKSAEKAVLEENLMFEVADCIIAGICMARFNDLLSKQMLFYILSRQSNEHFLLIPQFVERKMEINKKRAWYKDENGVYRHKENVEPGNE